MNIFLDFQSLFEAFAVVIFSSIFGGILELIKDFFGTNFHVAFFLVYFKYFSY